MLKKIRIFETFAGIGAQRKALDKIGQPYEVVGISEWFIDAIIAYDAIHHSPDEEYKVRSLENFTLSKDSSHPAKKEYYINNKQLEMANSRSKNFGSILEIKGVDMPSDIDLFTYSFPCQDLSTGGKNAGIKEGTRSGLLLEVERLLKEMKTQNKLPKYLLMENVPPLLSDTHRGSYERWLAQLEKMGYSNQTLVLNSKDFGLAQSRKRVFAISALNKPDFEINVSKHIVDMPSPKSFLRDSKKYKSETDEVQLNKTPSRELMWKINGRSAKDLSSRPFNTITTNMDRQNNAGLIRYSGPKGDSYRMLTPRESFLLMGFDEEDFNKVSDLGWTWRKFNKLAGNSIAVNVLEAIFKEIQW